MLRAIVFAVLGVVSINSAYAATETDALKIYANALYTEAVAADAGDAEPSALLPDPGFSASGMKAFWPTPTNGWSSVEDGLRVVPWVRTILFPTFSQEHAGYYVLGRQKNTAGNEWRGWVTRISLTGVIDTTFGSSGWIYSNSGSTITDAALGENRAYFLANFTLAGVPLTRVLCVDLSTGTSCFTGFQGIQSWDATTAGPNTGAVAQRLLYDSRYGLFVAARVRNTDHGYMAGVARINASDGSAVSGFGTGGYLTIMSISGDWTDNEVNINDLTIPKAGTPGGTRLYVAGQGKRANGNFNAFTLGLNPATGSTATNWGWYWHWFTGPEYDNQKSAISALAVLDDGRLAVAGWAETTDPNYRPMYLGMIRADHTSDPNFCPDSNWVCLVDIRASGGTFPFTWSYVPFTLPVALSQTRNGDLIVADRFRDNGYSLLFEPINHVHQRVSQFSGSGLPQLKSSRVLDYPAMSGDNADWWSRPFGMWVGGTGSWDGSQGSGTGEEVIAVVGTRKWTNDDYDATLSHLLFQSELLSDGFEGP